MRWNEFTMFLQGMIERDYGATAYLLRDLIFQNIAGNPYIKTEWKPVKVTDLMIFPFEELPKPVEISDSEYKAMVKAFKL